jgi:hypothetical protein
MTSDEKPKPEWVVKVEECARTFSRDMEQAYTNNFKASNLHVPTIVGSEYETKGLQLNMFLDALIGSTLWVITQKGTFADEELEESLVRNVRSRFAEFRAAGAKGKVVRMKGPR